MRVDFNQEHPLVVAEFKAQYPNMWAHVVAWEFQEPFRLILTLDIGETYVYNTSLKALRRVCVGSTMTDLEWRREFGQRLLDLLWFRGITQSELSDKTGISRRTITGYINGVSIPSALNAVKLASALDCDVRDLIILDGYSHAWLQNWRV